MRKINRNLKVFILQFYKKALSSKPLYECHAYQPAALLPAMMVINSVLLQPCASNQTFSAISCFGNGVFFSHGNR